MRPNRTQPVSFPTVMTITAQPRTYQVVTYGCQMNVHDSERLAGLLESAGYVRAPEGAAGRRRRLQHLRGAGERRQPALRQPRQPGPDEDQAARACRSPSAAAWPRRTATPSSSRRPGSTSSSAPTTSARCRCCWSAPGSRRRPRSRSPSRWRRSPRPCPPAASRAYAAWVSISVGCNNTCTFCIVPALRGKEKDRRPGDILAEIEALVAEGVQEITLLGQNVNAYGVDFGDREAFGKLLRACGADRRPGAGPLHLAAPARLHRRRDRGHGRDAERDAAAAHAAAVRLRPGAEGDAPLLPQERYLGIIDKVRAAMPDAAITTDIIVGFPGETEEDFAETLRRGARRPVRRGVHLPVLHAPRHARRRRCRTRSRRRRPGALRAAGRAGRRSPGRRTRSRSAGPSRCWSPRARAARTAPPHRLSGRARDNRLVHFADAGGAECARRATSSRSRSPTPPRTTCSPTAAVRGLRRTRGGDAWDARNTPQKRMVGLGLPTRATSVSPG